MKLYVKQVMNTNHYLHSTVSVAFLEAEAALFSAWQV